MDGKGELAWKIRLFELTENAMNGSFGCFYNRKIIGLVSLRRFAPQKSKRKKKTFL